MQTILITGGTGLLGTHLTNLLLQRGYKVIVVGRSNNVSNLPNLTYATWNLQNQSIKEQSIKQADAIVNLAGANVGTKRWTPARKKEILESRTKAGSLIVKALQDIPNNVRTVIQASATGWYKKHEDNTANTEDESPNTDYLGNTCKLWEESITPIETLNKRLVILRFGIILSNLGGALKEFKKPLQFKFAPILGNGQQKISWIHIQDAAMAIIHSLEQKNIKGIYNTVAPSYTTNKILTTTLAQKICNNFYIPFYVPSFLLKMVLGEMSEEVLKSTNASAIKLQTSGFNFSYPEIETAIEDLVKNKNI